MLNLKCIRGHWAMKLCNEIYKCVHYATYIITYDGYVYSKLSCNKKPNIRR